MCIPVGVLHVDVKQSHTRLIYFHEFTGNAACTTLPVIYPCSKERICMAGTVCVIKI